VPEVVGADEFAGLGQGEPAQRCIRILRPRRVRLAGGHEVAEVGVLVLGLSFARGDVAHHDVLDAAVRPRHQVGQAGLLRRLPQRDRQRVALPRVRVAARLQPLLEPLVPAQQHAAAVWVQHQRRCGEVQRQRP
jgi:hypothetical protein